MATRYQREQRTSPLSVPNAPMPPSGGGAAIAAGLVGLGAGLGRLGQNQQDDKDTTAYLGAVKELNDAVQFSVHDPEQGALRTQGGEESIEASRKAMQDLDKVAGLVMGGVKSERARLMVQRAWQQRRAETERTLGGHGAQEIEKEAQADAQGAITSEVNRAASNFTDLTIVGGALDAAEAATRAEMKRQGITDKDTVDTKVLAVTSAVHSQVARRYVDSGDATTAAVYLADNRDEMTPEDAGQLERAIKPQADLQRAVALSDEVWAKAGRDPVKALELLDSAQYAQHPQRTQAADLIDERAVRNRQARAEVSRTLSIDAYRTFSRDYRVSDIPTKLMRQIDEHDPQLGDWFREQDAQARTREREARRTGLEVEKLERERAGLEGYALAMSEAYDDPDSFIKRNLVVEYPGVDESHMTTLLNRQDSLRENLRAGQPGLFDPKERLVKAAEDAGIIPRRVPGDEVEWSDKEAQAFGKLERDLDQWIRGQTKKPSTEEVMEAIGQLTTKIKVRSAWSLGPFGRGRTVPMGALTPEERGKAFVPINEIPKEQQLALSNLLQSQAETEARRTGGKIPKIGYEQIEDAYGQAITGARPDYAAALSSMTTPAAPSGGRTRDLVRQAFIKRGQVPSEDQLNRAVNAAIKNDGDTLRRILAEK